MPNKYIVVESIIYFWRTVHWSQPQPSANHFDYEMARPNACRSSRIHTTPISESTSICRNDRHNAHCSGIGSNLFFRDTAETSSLSPRISNHTPGKYCYMFWRLLSLWAAALVKSNLWSILRIKVHFAGKKSFMTLSESFFLPHGTLNRPFRGLYDQPYLLTNIA